MNRLERSLTLVLRVLEDLCQAGELGLGAGVSRENNLDGFHRLAVFEHSLEVTTTEKKEAALRARKPL